MPHTRGAHRVHTTTGELLYTSTAINLGDSKETRFSSRKVLFVSHQVYKGYSVFNRPQNERFCGVLYR